MYISAMRFPLADLHRGRRRSISWRNHSGSFAAIGLICISIAAGSICAQQSMSANHNMADMQPVLPPEQLPAPIRMSGIGNAHITITANAEAQAWFDQGLNLMHDFWDYESVKAFE